MNVVATPKFLHLLLKQGYQNQRNLILLVILLAMVASIGTKVLLFYWQLTENPSNSDGSINTTVTKSGSDIKYEDFELIFGFSEQQASQVTNQRDIPTTRLSLTLRGIIANPENSEYDSAIIQSANQDKLYFLGDALPGGAILNRVYADYVVIKRGSQLEKLYFPDAARDSRTLQ
ncbi:MAG: type II secretion system protein N, partial [Endozoicomonas sp.]